MVSIVGAGPGDPDLITVKGLKALRTADVVVYDRLIARELLDVAPPTAERIYVGKAPGRHAMSQSQINETLIDAARRSRHVVRLKGGDPFVFGRGGEEVLALAAAGIPFEVVPGVTSAFGVPAVAGIPMTMRGVANSVTVVTGHQGLVDVEERGTLVILMGVAELPAIVQRLLGYGYAADIPVSIVQEGTTPKQRVIVGTLASIARLARLSDVSNPAVIVVGHVAAFARTSHEAPQAAIA